MRLLRKQVSKLAPENLMVTYLRWHFTGSLGILILAAILELLFHNR